MSKQDIQPKEINSIFVVKVLYTRNSTWQGEIVWVDKNQTKRFRSVMEMIKIMDSALEK